MSRPKTETVRRAFLLSIPLDEKMAELQEHLGLRNMTSVIEYCINSTYKKEIDNYVTVTKNRAPRNLMSPDERVRSAAQKYQDRKDANNDLALERGTKICELLDGTTETDGAGNIICKWNVYQKETPHYVSTGAFSRSIKEMTEDLVEAQYRGGDKEEIINILNNQ